jgi:hypothetical protein
MKLVLVPPKAGPGYTPQDAIYDWSVGTAFSGLHTDDQYDITDVYRLYKEGYTKLVFLCGGASATIDLVNKQNTFNRRAPAYSFVREAPGFSRSLYATEDVIKAVMAPRGQRREPLYKEEK